MTPTLTVCARPNGLPMAITQSPGSIWLESPNFASGSGAVRFLDELKKRAVGQRIASDDFRFVVVLVLVVEELHFDLRRAFDDVVVRQDEAVLVDDEARAGGLRGASRGCCRRGAAAALRLLSARGSARPSRGRRTVRADRPPPKNSLRSCVRCRDSVRMLTTIGDCALAMCGTSWRRSGRSAVRCSSLESPGSAPTMWATGRAARR